MKPDTIVIERTPTSLKIKIVLGVIIGIITVILAFLFRFEAGIVALVVGTGYGLTLAARAYHDAVLGSSERRKAIAEARKAEAEADLAERRSWFLDYQTGVFQLVGSRDVAQFYPGVSASKALGLNDVPPMLPAPVNYRKFLDVDWTHLLIVGPTNVGKSTLMCHIADHSNATTYIVDPHATQNAVNGLHWPPYATIVGDGRDWAAVDRLLVETMTEMNRRYSTVNSFHKMLIVIDEWLSILKFCEHAGEFFEVIGSEARKVKISLVIGTISRTVSDLNVSANVRDNLTQIMLSRTYRTQNLGEITWSRGDKELVELPGPYYGRPMLPASVSPMVEDEPQLVEGPLPELDAGPQPFKPTEDQRRVYEEWIAGNRSLRSIYQSVYPDKTFGGNQASEVKAILAKFNVIL